MASYVIFAGVLGFSLFLLLRPRVKILIAFFIMTASFDLAPRMILNKDIWDLGAILLLTGWVQLLFMRRQSTIYRATFITLLQVFIGWMFVCILWSILIDGYPVLATLKASRQMIVGFLSLFVFLRLFSVDPQAFDFFKKALYVSTFLLLPVTIIQYALGKPLLFGLNLEYKDVLRSLPVFLPICLLYFWCITSKIFTGEMVNWHEKLYAGMVAVVTAITFTRGIYLSVLATGCAMFVTLALQKQISVRSTIIWASTSAICLSLLMIGGLGEKVLGRMATGVDIVFSGKSKVKQDGEDTFTGRLALTKERFDLVFEHNPMIGYGFIHEDNVSNALRAKLQHGSVIYSPEYVQKYQYGHPYVLALHSADIGWADMVVNTGLIGFSLFVLIMSAFIINYYVTAQASDPTLYQLRLAFLLQMITLLLLMFNSNPFIVFVQIPSIMLAGYAYCSLSRPSVYQTINQRR